MAFRAASRVLVLATLVVAVNLAIGCNGDDDDSCIECCECSNDNDPLVFRPGATSECLTCEEQCQALADREFLGQEFDHAKEIRCDHD